MSFTPKFLKEIGIKATSVPEDLTARFTNLNHSTLQVKSPGEETIDIQTGAGQSQASINDNIYHMLINLGAKPAELHA